MFLNLKKNGDFRLKIISIFFPFSTDLKFKKFYLKKMKCKQISILNAEIAKTRSLKSHKKDRTMETALKSYGEL